MEPYQLEAHRPLNTAHERPPVTDRYVAACQRIARELIQHAEQLINRMPPEPVVLFAVEPPGSEAAPVAGTQRAVMYEHLFAECSRLPAEHPRRRYRNPVHTDFGRNVSAHLLETDAPE